MGFWKDCKEICGAINNARKEIQEQTSELGAELKELSKVMRDRADIALEKAICKVVDGEYDETERDKRVRREFKHYMEGKIKEPSWALKRYIEEFHPDIYERDFKKGLLETAINFIENIDVADIQKRVETVEKRYSEKNKK